MSCSYHIRIGCLLLAAIGLACAGAKPYQATFNAPVLRAREAAEVTKDGVTIAVDPITRENMMQFPEITRVVSWREPDPGGQGQMVKRDAPVALVPLPSFRIRIVNRGKHPVSLARAQFQLQDDRNRRYAPILDPVALKGRLVADIQGQNAHIANDRSLMETLRNEVQQVPILNPMIVVPPGGTWVGILPFDTPTRDQAEYAAFMSSLQSLILRLEGTDTGRSGTTGTEFAFFIDKGNRPVAVTCPADVKEPSLEKCTSNEPSGGTESSVTRPNAQTPR
jgi:hypothetical protein